MNITKTFEEAFKQRCLFSNHAISRLKQRFLVSELNMLKLLVQSALKQTSLDEWVSGEPVALVDERFGMSMVCFFDKDTKIINIVTFIRGKDSKDYSDCKVISASISKEKAEQEAAEIKALSQKSRMKI